MEPQRPLISRRLFLVGSISIVAAACSGNDDDAAPSTAATEPPTTSPPDTTAPTTTLPATTTTTEPPIQLESDPFTLGVASGDPDLASVVLWTRLAPEPTNGGGMPDIEVPVLWEISATDDFAEILVSGTEVARPADGHAIHAVVDLGSGWWFYRFQSGGFTSATGRTRVAPPPDDVEPVRFASASCQNYEAAYYHAHRDLAEQQPDFVVWLGDYIYEGGSESAEVAEGDVRSHNSPEPTEVVGYRNRYALYRTDADLRAAHAACPWFVIWDDHEVENNYASVTPQDPVDVATFPQRRFEAYRAWWEHMPVRLPAPTGPDDDYPIYRAITWGGLVGMSLLDGRQYRTDQACGDVTLSLEPPCDEVASEGRTMLGSVQEQFLFDTLGSQGTTWNVIAQQTVFADVRLGEAVLNFDQWDGYPDSRQRILSRLVEVPTPNVVVLTGDIHLAGTANLRFPDPGTGQALGVEFVATSVSSNGNVGEELESILQGFPSLVDVDLVYRGYIVHTVSAERWQADFRSVDDAKQPTSTVRTSKTFEVLAGSNSAQLVGG